MEEVASHLDLKHQIDVPAILDIKWCHNLIENKPVFGMVNADGCLDLWHPCEDDTCKLYHSHSIGDDRLALSLDWSTGKYERQAYPYAHS